MKAISALQAVFAQPDYAVSGPFIHALCPKLIELIGQYATELSTQQTFSDFKCLAVKELIHTLKVLVDIAANDKSMYHLLKLFGEKNLFFYSVYIFPLSSLFFSKGDSLILILSCLH